MQQTLTAPGPLNNDWIQTFNANRLTYLIEAQKEYGDVVRFPVSATRSYWLINRLDAIDEVLVTKLDQFARSAVFRYRARKLLGGGLMMSGNEQNARDRRLIMPAFHRSRMLQYAAIMQEEAKNALDTWPTTTGTANITQSMMQYGIHVVARCLFGTDALLAIDQIASAMSAGINYLDSDTEPLPTEAITILRQLGSQFIERRTTNKTDDLVSMLLEARYDDGTSLSNEQIIDHLLNLFTAGHESTVNVICWILYLLSSRPDLQQKITSELAEITAPGSFLEQQTPWLNAVLNEGLRMYPVAWFMTREALSDVTLADQYLIKKGDAVTISPYIVHHSDQYWPNHNTFDPTRFLNNDWNPQAFLPFSAGPRYCIGRPFAMLELRLALFNILSSYTINPTNFIPEVEPHISLRPRGGLTLSVTHK